MTLAQLDAYAKRLHTLEELLFEAPKAEPSIDLEVLERRIAAAVFKLNAPPKVRVAARRILQGQNSKSDVKAVTSFMAKDAAVRAALSL